MKQNRGHRLTQQRLQETILDKDTWQTYKGLNTQTNDRGTCEQWTINQWQDTWQDHMTNRESHDGHGTWHEQTYSQWNEPKRDS